MKKPTWLNCVKHSYSEVDVNIDFTKLCWLNVCYDETRFHNMHAQDKLFLSSLQIQNYS
ncbi:unnamed protein product [Lupinus luteus]|uniref:Uncharacterized protein n=1 Tax=Lupinus luteus TaxID=3873 RepID=A0AAV1VWK9_LUPLU